MLLLDEYTPIEDFPRKFREVFKDTEMAKTFYSIGRTGQTYVQTTLYESALVCHQFILNNFGKEKPIAFGVSKFGKKFGKLAAAQALWFEKEHKADFFERIDNRHQKNVSEQFYGISLSEILGSINKGQKEADRGEQQKHMFFLFLHRKEHYEYLTSNV